MKNKIITYKGQKKKKNKMKKINDKKKKKISILGKVYKYNGVPDLSKQLKFAEHMRENRNIIRSVIGDIKIEKVIHNTTTGEFAEIDLSKRPLILREYGIKRITQSVRKSILLAKQIKIDGGLGINIIEIRNKNEPFNKSDILYLTYDVELEIKISDDTVIRHVKGIYRGTIDGLNESILNDIEIYMSGFGEILSWAMISKKIYSVKSNKEFDLASMTLKKLKALDISINMYEDIVDVEGDNGNCVRNYLYTILNKNGKGLSKKTIDKLGNDIGVTTGELMLFCEKYKIKCIAYDINGNVIASHIPTINKTYKSLIYIAYDNHIYPVEKKILSIKNPVVKSYVKMTQEDINKEFNKVLYSGIMPSKISIGGFIENVNINSFYNNGTLYYINEDYDNCMALLKAYGMEDKMKHTINKYNVLQIFERIYVKENIDSFAPELKHFKKTAYIYNNGKIYDEEQQYETIDKVLHYSNAICSLPFLIVCDTRQCKINIKPKEIIPHNLYLVRPFVHSILIPDTNVYSGYHLIKTKKVGFEQFELLEEIECGKTKNSIGEMVLELCLKYMNDNNRVFIKEIINIYLAKFEQGCGDVYKIPKVSKICNNDESTYSDIAQIEYDENYKICVNYDNKYKIYTRKPIRIQLMDESRFIVYNKMQELVNKGIMVENIVQIKTDAITYINNVDNDGGKRKRNNKIITKNGCMMGKRKLKIDNIDSKMFNGWKYAEYNKISEHFAYDNEIRSLIGNYNENNNIIVEAYAGCGKTYEIINRVVPTLKQSYIVLSPTHASLEEYRQANIVSNIIHKYIPFNGITPALPTQDIIIIDEIGLCGREANDLIYKCYLAGKIIISYGDFKQLLPINEFYHFNQEHYLNMIYSKKGMLNINRRNEFSISYYNLLISGKIDLLGEIKKYSVKNYYDAECIICYYNNTRKKYNEMYMKYYGIQNGDIGMKIICKSNNMRHKNIYNNYILTIVDKDDEHYILSNNKKITIKEFINYFEPAYARTIYTIQGKSLDSYYIAEDNMDHFNNGRSAYTIISRLKGEMINMFLINYNVEDINRNVKENHKIYLNLSKDFNL